MPCSVASFRITLSDSELSEIFNDTKHRAVCLRQLCFLQCVVIELKDFKVTASNVRQTSVNISETVQDKTHSLVATMTNRILYAL